MAISVSNIVFQGRVALSDSAWRIAHLALMLVVTFSASAAYSQEESSRRAIAYYGDAASFQNNGAFDLAIDEWNKLLSEFPKDPLASKAAHYLGVCYASLEPPKLDLALNALRRSLEDRKLDIRDETLIRAAELLYSKGRATTSTNVQKSAYQEAKKYLTEFMKEHSESSSVDRGLFYLGEIEYALGDLRRSIAYHTKLIRDDRFKTSKLLPDARYAVAVAHEEQEQWSDALDMHKEFLREHSSHRLSDEVSVRLGDIYLRTGDTRQAQAVLGKLTRSQSSVADYALLRLGYALSLSGDKPRAATYYKDLLQRFPNSKHASAARLSLGQLLLAQGDSAEARKQLEPLIAAKDDLGAQALHLLATLLINKEPATVENLLRKHASWTKSASNAVDLKMDLADALYAQPSKLEESLKLYEEIATSNQDHPIAPRAAYNTAFAALQLKQFAQARKWASLFLTRYPQDPLRSDVAYVAAETLLQQGEHTAASEAFAKLRSSDPSNPSSQQWLLRQAMAYYLDGQHPKAISLLSPQADQFDDAAAKAEAYFILGGSNLFLENLDKAIEQLTQSHKASSRWTAADEVLLLLSEAQQQSGNPEQALATLKDLLAKFPNTRLKQQVEYKLAQLSAAIGDYDDAIAGYRAVTQDADSVGFHRFAQYGIAWCQMQQGDFAAALTELKPLLASDRADSIFKQSQLAAGVCYRKTEQPDEAISLLESYLKSSPDRASKANAMYELGLAFMQKKNTKQADQVFLQLMDESPAFPKMDRVLYELAWNAKDRGDDEAAMLQFSRLATQFKNSDFGPEAQYLLGESAYDAGDYAKAGELYAQVLKEAGTAPIAEKALYKFGWSQFQQKQFSESEKSFQKQTEQFPNSELTIDGLFMSGECQFELGNYDAALAQYKDARQLLESGQKTLASNQVQSLIYLHGAQCYRERKDWTQCLQWLQIVDRKYKSSPYRDVARYEMAYCLQKQNKEQEALQIYEEVARNNPRGEIGARARFMSGEVFFTKRDFVAAIKEFQRVMFGFGGSSASEEIKNWQAKAAFEAARCTEVLAADRQGSDRQQLLDKAQEYYDFIVQQHGSHSLAAKAQSRLGELRSLR